MIYKIGSYCKPYWLNELSGGLLTAIRIERYLLSKFCQQDMAAGKPASPVSQATPRTAEAADGCRGL